MTEISLNLHVPDLRYCITTYCTVVVFDSKKSDVCPGCWEPSTFQVEALTFKLKELG